MVKISAKTELTAPDASDWLAMEEAASGLVKKVSLANFQKKMLAAGGDAWTTFTPTWANLTLGNGTITGRYKQVGKKVTVNVHFVFGTTTSITGSVGVTPPLTPDSRYNSFLSNIGGGLAEDVGTATYPLVVLTNTLTSFILCALLTNATFATAAQIGASTPFTFGTGDRLSFMCEYEAA